MRMLNDEFQREKIAGRAVISECDLKLKAGESSLGYKTILQVTVFSIVQG